MKTKSNLLNKQASICCFILVFFFNSKICAQIIYTDIEDATPNATFTLDLNNDSVDDFTFYFGSGIMCAPLQNNAYSGNFVGGVHLPWALAASNTICEPLATWYGTNYPGTLAIGTSSGYWVGASNKYIALKIIVGSNTYYGWARLDILSSSGSFTIKDYAYESTPNACIQSGQNGLSNVENTSENVVSVIPNPFTNATTLQVNDNLKDATLTIYNLNGQILKQVNTISGNLISISRDNLPSGLYFITLTEENKTIAVEKLIITD
jgi:hypothetical protein